MTPPCLPHAAPKRNLTSRTSHTPSRANGPSAVDLELSFCRCHFFPLHHVSFPVPAPTAPSEPVPASQAYPTTACDIFT